MILVDTSVWVDHLRRRENGLTSALARDEVLGHPFVTGEIACGNLRQRSAVLGLLDALPQAPRAGDDEVRALIERRALMGRGVGWVDAHLLAAALLAGASMWTRDRPLAAVAAELGLTQTSS